MASWKKIDANQWNKGEWTIRTRKPTFGNFKIYEVFQGTYQQPGDFLSLAEAKAFVADADTVADSFDGFTIR
jgi:hypothetical protein